MNRADKRRQKNSLKNLLARNHHCHLITINHNITVDEAYKHAIDHFYAKRYTESDKFCTAILQTVPNYVDAINLLGMISQKINRHDLAIVQFQKAINIYNNRASLYYNLGTSLYQLERKEEAIQALKTALVKEPENIQIINYLNSIADKAESISRTSIQSHNEQEALQQGFAFIKLGQMDKAIHWYRKVLEINPENIEALSNIGGALQTIGKLEEAIAIYQKTVSIKPEFAEAYSNLGSALATQGKLEEAVTSYQKAISIKPDFAEAYSNLGNALQK
jgi:tetratricopeptide (TPR) repeat protein